LGKPNEKGKRWWAVPEGWGQQGEKKLRNTLTGKNPSRRQNIRGGGGKWALVRISRRGKDDFSWDTACKSTHDLKEVEGERGGGGS